MNSDITPRELALAKIQGETAKMNWSELLKFFASGHAIYVAPELDLVEAAFAMSEDNASQIKGWMEKKQVALVSDEQAKQWLDKQQDVWSVVVRPWVLVQPSQD